MSCESSHAVKTVRNTIKSATGIAVDSPMWHEARKKAGNEAKAKGPADPDQSIAAVKKAFSEMNVDPNNYPESRELLDSIERGNITLTRGQAEALRQMPALVKERLEILDTKPIPNEVQNIAEDINNSIGNVIFEDHSGVFEEVDTFSLTDLDWIDSDSYEASRNLMSDRFPEYDPEELKFESTSINLEDVPSSSLESYMMDGDTGGEELVEELMDAYENGNDIPPILVIDYGEQGNPDVPFKRYEIVDGYHRTAAAKESGISHLPAMVAKIDDPELLTKSGWVSLEHMSDPKVARNNCHAATHAVQDHLVNHIGVEPGWESGTIEMLYSGGVHWANTISDDKGNEWVIDYTARQFADDAPMPMIASAPVWREWVGSRINSLHGQTLHNVFKH